ncbi:MAG TPA: DUF4184 family protein, partial [Polyangiaceae bacterium]
LVCKARSARRSEMPVAFPSHQGLILPLWRRYPRAIDGVALCVGAAMPDVFDAAAWPFRGELGQWMGHSLVGLLPCVALGLPLLWLVRRFAPHAWLARLDRGAPVSPGLARAAMSLAIGALSHDGFDLVTHANFLLLWPWYTSDRLFPAWWARPWGSVDVLVYRKPYPLAPHTVVWGVLTVVGAFLFFWCLRGEPGGPDQSVRR